MLINELLYSTYMQQYIRIKQAFSILIIAFMIFSAFAIVSNHMNSFQNSRPNIIKNSVINHESQINVPESIHSALFGFNSSSYASSKYYDQSPEIATTDIQINSIIYHKGVYVLGGENTTQSPLLMIYNTSHKKMSILSSQVSSSIRYIDTMASEGDLVAFGGMPSGSNGQIFPVEIMNLSSNVITSLSTVYPYFSSVPNIYAMSFSGKDLFMGGYYQEAAQDGYLTVYNLSSGKITNLTSQMPQGTTMINVVQSYHDTLYVSGNAQNPSSFVQIFNLSTTSSHEYSLPSSVYGITSGYIFNDSLFLGGGSHLGGALYEISKTGELTNYSSPFTHIAQIDAISIMNGKLLIGGWGLNSSFASLLNLNTDSIIRNITPDGGFKTMGSNILSFASNSTTVLIGGTVSSQFTNYSGALLASVTNNYTYTDLCGDLQKSYTEYNYNNPLNKQFYVCAEKNILLPGSNLTIMGHDLKANAQYDLSFLRVNETVRTNSNGMFSMTYSLNRTQKPGDYLIKLQNSSNRYYNYFAIACKFDRMIHGAQYPEASKYIPYSNLKYGSVVMDGNYLEFFRIANGTFPYTSLDYEVEWNQILFENLTSRGWTVAPLNQLDYASQYSINPLNDQYSPWTDYDISKVTQSAQFTNFNTQNSYFYLSGDTMITWIPFSDVNESKIYWSLDTDYVQNSPVYNPAYRVEIGQDGISLFNSTVAPTAVNQSSTANVHFFQKGLPSGQEWSVKIISTGANGSNLLNTVCGNGREISISLNNGTYKYVISSQNALYTTSNATGLIHVNGYVQKSATFIISPESTYYQVYTPVNGTGERTFTLDSTDSKEGISFGVMNSTLNVKIYLGTEMLYHGNITGTPYTLISMGRTGSYGFVNFNGNGNKITIYANNSHNQRGYIAFSLWNYYIDSYTASMITVPPQFSENLNGNNFLGQYNNTGLSFTLKAPYYRYPVALAFWIGEGYSNPVTGKNWWAQIGFNNWLYGMNDVSYAGWGAFSNIFGSPGGTDGNYPMVPNETYTITMELVKNTTWGFFINGHPIIEPGLDGYLNTTSKYANGGVTMGFEVLTEARSGYENTTSLLPDPVKAITAQSVRINGRWIQVSNFSFNNIGEDWYNDGATSSPGMNLWSTEGHIQNSSIGNGTIIFSNTGAQMFDIPVTQQYTVAYPLYGRYTYPYENMNLSLNYADAKLLSNDSIYLKINNNSTLVSIISLDSSGTLLGFRNFVLNNGTYYIPNRLPDGRIAVITTLKSNAKSLSYDNRIEEMELRSLKGFTSSISFMETDLPSHLGWYVNLSNGFYSGQISSSSYTFALPNGTYNFTVASSIKSFIPDPAHGTITVDEKSFTVTVNFTLIGYNLTFKENGLPDNYVWYVDLADGYSSGSIHNDSYTFHLINGTYDYNISDNNAAYMPNITIGSVIINGKSKTVDITFSETRFSIYFVSYGLPAGTGWNISLNGIIEHSDNRTITFSDLPGIYNYTVYNLSSYYALPHSGFVDLVNSNISVTVSYFSYAYLAIGVTPSAFTIMFNGKKMDGNSSISMKLVSGNYTLSIMSSGYVTQNMTLFIRSGSNVEIIVNLQKVHSGSSVSQLGIYAIMVGAGALVGILWGALVFRKK
jgi:hypothetical protein